MMPHAGQPVVSAGAPLGQGRGVMIMVHGRNAGPANILDLVPRLGRPEFTYLAPAAANGTWYPFGFMTDIGRNEPDLSSALSVIEELVSDLVARSIRREQIMLLGFSQGACLSAEFVVRHADRFGGVIVLSGGLIGPPGTTWTYGGDFKKTPIFLGCSDVDAHIPKARVEESAEVFTRMGASVALRLYAGMGHLVSDDEIAFAQGVMDRIPGS